MEKYVCWDKDNTLGSFERGACKLRHGIKDTLSSLSRRGYTNILTTADSKLSTLEDLHTSGLIDFFPIRFYGQDVVPDDNPFDFKSYRKVSSFLGLSDESARQRMIIVGDKEEDKSLDPSGMILICQRYGYFYDASVIDKIISRMDSLSTDFNKSFNLMRNEGKYLKKDERRFYLDDLQFTLDYLSRNKSHPIIKNITARAYKRRPNIINVAF